MRRPQSSGASRGPPLPAGTGGIARTTVEVEQKFPLPPDGTAVLSSRLEELGFVCRGTEAFTDWYFDNAGIMLSTRDCWLRYRATAGRHGSWQLKRRGRAADAGSSATVYEEIEGREAVDVALSTIGGEAASSGAGAGPEPQDSTWDGHVIPKLPVDESHDLVPFCRLETVRTSWERRTTNDSAHDDDADHLVRVDLDCTNTGYGVGEVEIVVNHEDEVPDAEAKIRMVVDQILQGQGEVVGPPIGKLEHFLQNHRPWHYEACVKSGVLK
jgi:hypothetical protein